MNATAADLTAVLPSIRVGAGGTVVPTERVTRVVVDSHLHLPDMFEIQLTDRNFDIVSRAGLSLATPVEIWAGAGPETKATQLVVGEVTAIEAVLDGRVRQTVIRGYSQDHRLQRARRTRTFVNMTDADIAKQIAKEAGLDVGDIEPTTTTYPHVGQTNQTDWDFLSLRALNAGCEIGMTAGKFYFRKAAGTAATGAKPVDLVYYGNLRAFRARLTGGNLSTEAEVRGWDNLAATAITAKIPVETGSVRLDNGKGNQTAALFEAKGAAPAAKSPGNPALGNLGPAPSEKAHVVGRPMAMAAAADQLAGAVSEGLASTFAEADGEAVGNPLVVAGAVAAVSGVPDAFTGQWVITSARHVFDLREHGYRTHFEVSGRQRRTLLGLASGGAAPTRTGLNGLACGVVSNVLDEAKAGRVKVTLPWLSPLYETDWAPVVQLGAGPRSGALFLPEVGDQVLVGFELGDPQRPFVLGGVLNNDSAYQQGLGGAPTKASNATGDVVWRGVVTPSGNRLAFHDELPPGAAKAPPTASEVVLGTGGGNLSLAIDQVAGTVALRCDPKPPESKSPQGKLTIECGNAGAIDIKTGTGGMVTIDGGAQLNLKAMTSVKIESTGVLELKGNPIKLN